MAKKKAKTSFYKKASKLYKRANKNYNDKVRPVGEAGYEFSQRLNNGLSNALGDLF